uniref:RecQ-mediated genome instability protein 1 n=1 Tax=Chromera velia CCMP2878 TaxID=1169474 RepID=A0A0G4FBV6_9ALVE|eukprot:Cvel_16091.t1-p1 / transcript=Cvel_16091.t1 / gene=Cvel_16091 / organism=Chromera_velia_CCMP2878 / gene_product=RecQ-mediated genome instability protein 1, putative / transcript_product=RecQ-mediated genome instability protein 1, putative / location=Cvel_scaffold1224:31872-33788(+) / protein_length=639 / sequence_SO=supercontig / SO=protein_coding / is_pseudo=false
MQAEETASLEGFAARLSQRLDAESGLRVRTDWLLNTLRQHVGPSGSLPLEQALNLCFKQLLKEDIRLWSEGTLPLGISNESVECVVLEGSHMLQVDAGRNIAESIHSQRKQLVDNETQTLKASKRTLKLQLSDGHTTLPALEYRSVPCIPFPIAYGTKILVSASPEVHLGLLLLQSENVRVVSEAAVTADDIARAVCKDPPGDGAAGAAAVNAGGIQHANPQHPAPDPNGGPRPPPPPPAINRARPPPPVPANAVQRPPPFPPPTSFADPPFPFPPSNGHPSRLPRPPAEPLRPPPAAAAAAASTEVYDFDDDDDDFDLVVEDFHANPNGHAPAHQASSSYATFRGPPVPLSSSSDPLGFNAVPERAHAGVPERAQSGPSQPDAKRARLEPSSFSSSSETFGGGGVPSSSSLAFSSFTQSNGVRGAGTQGLSRSSQQSMLQREDKAEKGEEFTDNVDLWRVFVEAVTPQYAMRMGAYGSDDWTESPSSSPGISLKLSPLSDCERLILSVVRSACSGGGRKNVWCSPGVLLEAFGRLGIREQTPVADVLPNLENFCGTIFVKKKEHRDQYGDSVREDGDGGLYEMVSFGAVGKESGTGSQQGGTGASGRFGEEEKISFENTHFLKTVENLSSVFKHDTQV